MSRLFTPDSPDPKDSKQITKPDQTHYHFRYNIFNVEIEFKDNQLTVQMGIKVHVINLDTLFAVYRRDLKSQAASELTLAYRHKNKIKRARIYADLGETEFELFCQNLKRIKRGIDISDLPQRQAYEHMGSKDQPWLVVLALMGLSIILLSVLGLPLLLHGLDHGKWSVSINDIYQNPSLLNQPPSRNLSFSGQLDLSQALTIIEGHGEDAQKQIIAPIYPTKPQKRVETVLVLVSLKGRSITKLKSLQKGEVNQGVLRNIWWEGLGEQNKLKLRAKGLSISEQTVLIEMGITRRDDLQLYLSFIIILSLFTAVTVLYLKPVTYKTQI